MKLLTTTPALALASGLALAAPPPWGEADPEAGKAHHDKACVACHSRLYGGDGSRMYTRQGSLMTSRLDILQRVASCNSQTRSGWFPEEEAEVAAWLNQQYYRFSE